MGRLVGALSTLVLLAAMACAPADISRDGGTIRLYTSITQETVDAVLAGIEKQHPELAVQVFRAPTGEINARLAAEQREGGIRADVLWLSDPLSIQQYDAQGLLRSWEPAEASAVPAEYRANRFFGTAILEVLAVHRRPLERTPDAWHDLADPAYQGAVAIPDPSFAGSAFGALGYFALSDEFGFEFYRSLKDNGAVQVQSPGEALTGVAEGRFEVGMTIDIAAREAVEKGSAVEMVSPRPGAIAVYSPIAIFTSTRQPLAAEALVEYLLSKEGQEVVAGQGRRPARPDVEWPHRGPVVSPDWQAAFDRQQELLKRYQAIFGG